MPKREYPKALKSQAVRRDIEKGVMRLIIMGKIHTAAKYCSQEVEGEGFTDPKDRAAHISMHVAVVELLGCLTTLHGIQAIYDDPDFDDEAADAICEAAEEVLARTGDLFDEAEDAIDIMVGVVDDRRDEDAKVPDLVGLEDMPKFVQDAFTQKGEAG